ncbi:hypothetical protein BVY01_02035, partial [bacterium I07]
GQDQGYPSWSQDSRSISFLNTRNDSVFVRVVQTDGTNPREYFLNYNKINGSSAWSADSKKIAFLEKSTTMQGKANLRILDLETGNISSPLKHVEAYKWSWAQGGMTWSRDGKFLVYVGWISDSWEILALPMKKDGSGASGKPFAVTNIDGPEIPSWPTLTSDSKMLSYGLSAQNSDIYSCTIEIDQKRLYGELRQITTSKFLEVGPCWTTDGEHIIFASDRNKRVDLFRKNINSGDIKRLTNSVRDESNPQITPDGNISFWDRESSVWKIPFEGGKATQITPDSIQANMGYAWHGDNLLLNIKPPDQKDYGHLYEYDLRNWTRKLIKSYVHLWSQDIRLS